MKLIIGLLAAIAIVIATPTNAQSEEPNMAKVGPHLNLLNELSERRRPNTFFPNEQSQTYGVQVDYVNVGKGNLTFVRRDMVTVGRIPIVAARVYDSSAGDTGDFGPGWRFALAETVRVSDDELLYTDESGSAEALVPTQGNRYVPSMQALSDVQGAKLTGNKLTLTIRSGWTKEFKEIDGVYRLVKVSDRNGNALELRYQAAQLASVEGANGRRIDLARTADGRIDSITDDQGRSISYRYKPDGLFTVKDLGGQKWKMKYHTDGQLKKITDPLGNKALKAVYDDQGRVATANIRHRKNTFAYNGQTTSMTNGRSLTTRFTQGDAGITTKVVNAEGTTTKIILGDNLLPSKLKLNGELRNKFSYNDRGQLDQMTAYQPGKTLDQSYTFDWGSGQIESMASSDGTYMEFKYDAKGRLKKKKQGDTTTSYQYHGNGDLKQVKVAGEVAREFRYDSDGQLAWLSDAGVEATFRYDGTGKLKKVLLPDDEPFKYRYNTAGFRTEARAGGKLSKFDYDAAGRLQTITHDIEGRPNGFSYEMDADNLTRKINALNGTVIDIGYDEIGNPTSYGVPDNTHTYVYDQVSRFVGVTPSVGDELSIPYVDDEAGWRGRLDSRTGVNLAPEQTASAIYGSTGEVFFGRSRALALSATRFDSSSMTLQAMGNFGFVAPDSAQRATFSRTRLDSINAEPEERMMSFNRPSSAFFLPPELNQINCAIGCNVYLLIVEKNFFLPNVGQNLRFDSEAFADFDCEFGVINDWSWGDGSSGTSYGLYSSKFHSYSSPGLYSTVVSAFCPCFGLFASDDTNVCVGDQTSANIPRPSLATTEQTVQYVGNNLMGFTQPSSFTTNGAECEQRCSSSTELAWQITGGLTGNVLARTSAALPIAGTSQFKNRTPGQVSATVLHERRHIEAWEDLADRFHSELDGTWSSTGACGQALVSADASVVVDITLTSRNECLHTFFATEPRYTVDAQGNQIESGFTYPLTPGDPGYTACL